MGLFSKNTPSGAQASNLPWIQLTDSDDLEATLKENQPLLIFKHSTRCGISSMALRQFEKEWDQTLSGCKLYFLDLLANRTTSNAVANLLKIVHQSPQVIVIKNDEIIYNDSHSGINAQRIQQLLNS